jgi:hypothetical protein
LDEPPQAARPAASAPMTATEMILPIMGFVLPFGT